jgi:tetratricopeptide (TPR) repeat protein
VGCLDVTELATTLPGIRFPVDVSGGVPRFRHRRGELLRVAVELETRRLEAWAAPLLAGTVGTGSPETWVGPRRDGATVCVTGGDGASGVLAFEVSLLAEDTDLVVVVWGARGTGLPRTATGLAIACVDALVGSVSTRAGAAFVVHGAAAQLARALLPDAGARVPSAAEVRWSVIGADSTGWLLQATRQAVAAAPSDDALRAREAAALLRDADDALFLDRTEDARALAVAALERAPRHPEVVRRIVEIDARAGGRAEAALATLADLRASAEPGTLAPLGTLPGELLAEIGDAEAAIASLERAAEAEPSPALGARALELAAGLSRDAEEALRWLDRAAARAPRSASVRWARVVRRLELGRTEDALADVEHLEALARGADARYAVWLRAGAAWRAAGIRSGAAPLYERALHYAPDDPASLAGLGASLVAEGRVERGAAVLTHAVEEAERRGEPAWEGVVALASVQAEKLDDAPAAIARVAAIPPTAEVAVVARGLEGRWRARLGDVAGAALAFARMRELGGDLVRATDPRAPRIDEIVGLLVEAAELERSRRHDPLAAQRHLSLALRLRPHDARVREAYRDAGEERAGAVEAEDEHAAFAPVEAASATHHVTAPTEPPAPPGAPDLAFETPPDEEDEATRAARVEELTRHLHADPRNDAVADELADLLLVLGRGHELLALLSARLEDAAPERRPAVRARARAALEHLVREADEAGRTDDAALFRDAIATLLG